MPTYLAEVKFACGVLLQEIWSEHERIEALSAKAERLQREMEDGYERAHAVGDAAEDADDTMLATGMYWDTYFGPDKEHHSVVQELERLQELGKVHQFSISVLSASLLQIAKQGLSVVHGGLKGSPSGRKIGSASLKEVVWEGRNQSSHWEAGKLKSAGVKCFSKLAKEQGGGFGDYQKRNLAFDVIQLLGWRTWEDFEKDLSALG